MTIRFTDHAILKIEILKKHGVEVSISMVEDIIKNPDKIERGYKNRMIAQKRISENHVLRVVYEEGEEQRLVITIYPGRRSRYEKD